MATSGEVVVESSKVPKEAGVVKFGTEPVEVTCPECEETGETDIYYQSGTFTYGLCLLLLFMGLWLGCFAIPFCMSGVKDCVHKCSRCGTEIGRFRRFDYEMKEP